MLFVVCFQTVEGARHPSENIELSSESSSYTSALSSYILPPDELGKLLILAYQLLVFFLNCSCMLFIVLFIVLYCTKLLFSAVVLFIVHALLKKGASTNFWGVLSKLM